MKWTIKFAIGTSVLALALVFTNQVNADDPDITLPAGVACVDFGLDIYITPSDHYVVKQWTDKYGQPVRMLTAGKGADLKFVNSATDATLSLKGNGSVSHTTYNVDGSLTVSAEGHNVLILFPTDLPPGVGPSTKQYVGRVVYTVDMYGTWTLKQEDIKGRVKDICAALSE